MGTARGTTSVLLLGAVLLTTLYAIRKLRVNQLCPPGPRGFPLLGYLNVLRVPDKRKLFATLREEHGDVFSFYLGCRLVVVINGFETLRQAFVHQGGSFVDRPRVFYFTYVGQGKGLFNSSGDVWREHRNFTLNALRQLSIGATSFAMKVEQELNAFCTVLDKKHGAGEDPTSALHAAIINISCSILFGKRFDYGDPVFQKFLECFDKSVHISDGMAPLNFFPFLLYMPGMTRARKQLKNVENFQSYLRKWLDNAQKKFDPRNVNSFADAYFYEMQDKKKYKSQTTFSYDQLLQLVADFMVGNTETTCGTLRWLIVFLVRWPRLQQRMKEEIESVYPFMATPSINDQSFMPFVEATILETLRFADVNPYSVTHAACEDVEMKGLVIPKGSIIVPNIHSVHHDPALWGDPETFRPERFLDENGVVVKPENLIPFFLGKRSCPGESIARMELFQFIITILQRYELKPAELTKIPRTGGRVGISYVPPPYKIRFVRRAH